MRAIQTSAAPAAIGTYSQAIEWGELLFISGQIPLDPQTMQLCSDDIREQIIQVFTNLKAVCEAAGTSLAHAVKLTIYLLDLVHFPLVNEIMADFCQSPFPARAVVAVSGLPRQAQIEIDGIVLIKAS